MHFTKSYIVKHSTSNICQLNADFNPQLHGHANHHRSNQRLTKHQVSMQLAVDVLAFPSQLMMTWNTKCLLGEGAQSRTRRRVSSSLGTPGQEFILRLRNLKTYWDSRSLTRSLSLTSKFWSAQASHTSNTELYYSLYLYINVVCTCLCMVRNHWW